MRGCNCPTALHTNIILIGGGLSNSMDLLENYYGKQTFLLYSLFAKVPGSRAWPRRIFVTFSILVLLFATVYQVLKLITEKFKREVIIGLLPPISVTIGTLLYVPYVAFTTEQKYKRLLSIMINDLREERTAEEEAIKRQYADSANMFTNAYTIIFAIGMCGISFSGFVTYLLDWIIPLNETRERQLIFKGEIFVDQEKYFHYFCAFEACLVFVVGIVVGVTENMSVIVAQHDCGMFAALGHRLENLTNFEEHELLGETDWAHLLTRKLEKYIEAHQKILQFAALGATFYDTPLTIVLIATSCSLTVSFVHLFDPELLNVAVSLFTFAQVFQMFVLSYMGQNVIDTSSQIAVHSYNAKWDACPRSVRQSLQLMILRSSKACQVIASNIYVLSVENFISVMQTILSFYVVIRQTQ